MNHILLVILPAALVGVLLAEMKIKLFSLQGLLVLLLVGWIGGVAGLVLDISNEIDEINRLLEASGRR